VSQGQYVAAVYGVVFVFVLGYVAIIAAKLARLQRQTAEVLELVARRRDVGGEAAGEVTRPESAPAS
jgi:hypothetical protein